MSNDKVTPADYNSPISPAWCPGCGDFAILGALKQALAELEIFPKDVLLVSGIGQISKTPNYVNANGFHTIHGRPLPVATGARLANPDLKVIVLAGDGDSYAIGGNHFLHTCRRNIDLTHIVGDNKIYGLTKGQYSPTSDKGHVTKTTPQGSIEPPVNPVKAALATGGSFISRGFAGEVNHLKEMFMKAIEHKGYSLVDVLQPCVTFNRVNTYDYWNERVYDLEDENYDPSDPDRALEKADEMGERIPIGVLFRDSRPTYEEQVPALQDGPIVDMDEPSKGPQDVDFSELKNRFM